ncbi:MAG: glycosyltransferase [Acidobacteriota bacterium]|nr:glycosyltransferase [Blastocatellia bacterium]MDW8238368.1 glycosyltransferase [Acidobacteriota bacterium]
MKIAFVVHDYHKAGGHSRYVAELAERFAREHDVHVFANRIEGDQPANIHFHHVPAWRASALSTILTFILPATLKLTDPFEIVHAQGLSCWRADVVTAHICQEGWFAAQAAYQGGLTWQQRLFRALVGRMERWVYQPAHSSHVIAISQAVRQDLRQHYGRTQNVHVIHHGVDVTRFHPNQRARHRAHTRAVWGLADTDFVALYVGDLQKGAATAIEAIARVEGARLVFVSRSQADSYRQQATALNAGDRVIFCPPTDQIERIYAAADALLFPTFYDAFGMVITEAMAMGLPVVTSRAAGAAELIEHERSGIIVEKADDATSFSVALRRLMTDVQLRERLGANARQTVEARTWDHVAEQTMAVYRRAYEQKHSAKPTIAFLINGGPTTPLSARAEAFTKRLQEGYDIHLLYRSRRKIGSLLRLTAALFRIKPSLSYVFDMSYSGVLAAALYKLWSNNRVVVDTGDVIYELAKSMGTRSRLGLWLTKQLETLSLNVADYLIVRGTRHKQWLQSQGLHRVEVIQDGIEREAFRPVDATALRRQLALENVLTIGLVGTSIWNERWDMGYGWELVEALRLLKGEPVKGILIGDGDGIARLKARCREYGLEDNMLFLGYVPHEQLPLYLNLIDVCISTQTNDLVGQVRTTGKLPLYLAAGRFILATRVGEAALVLDEDMLVDYEGVKDREYPQRLAQRIRAIVRDRAQLERGERNRRVAAEYFDYDVLAERLKNVISGLIGV